LKSLAFGLLVVAATAAGPSLAAAPSDAVTWYSIATQAGAAIGHAAREIVQGPDGRQIIESQDDDLGDQGTLSPFSPWFNGPQQVHSSWRIVRAEDQAGRTVSIASTSQTGPDWRNDWSRNDARIADGQAEIARRTPAETRVVIVALPPAVRFDGGDGLLRTWNPAATPRLEFEDFNIDAMAVDHVTIETVAGVPPDAQGRTELLRKTYAGRDLVAVAWLLLDRDGQIVQTTQPTFGGSVVIKATDKDTALGSHSPYRIVTGAMTKSPYRIGTTAMRGHIRYRFGFQSGIEFTVPQTGEQGVTAEPGFATVDICEDCGPGLPSDAATLAGALKPTAWLQSDSADIKSIAAPVAALAVSDARKMEILRRKTRAVLVHLDFTGHYSALETLSRRSGDCTEAAVLLAALGRAAGIPTRVANGLVYSREAYHGVSNAFLPHSWALAWVDGKWRSFDAALDSFDSTHIALTVGDGDARSLSAASQLAGLLHWESIVEVRDQPAN
jgi:hypothetical protein